MTLEDHERRLARIETLLGLPIKQCTYHRRFDRPGRPCSEFCLLAAGNVRWVSEVHLPERLWRLLAQLLETEHCISFHRTVLGGGRIKAKKTVQNILHQLNRLLAQIEWPYIYRVETCGGEWLIAAKDKK